MWQKECEARRRVSGGPEFLPDTADEGDPGEVWSFEVLETPSEDIR